MLRVAHNLHFFASCTCACRHLPKIFDNVHSLEFRKDAQDAPTKAAIGMYSGKPHSAQLSKLRRHSVVDAWVNTYYVKARDKPPSPLLYAL